jgi:hypothetical protein
MDIKNKYKVKISSKNISSETNDFNKKPINIFSEFNQENSFMLTQINFDTINSVDDDFSNSRQVIEQQKSLNKYNGDNQIKNNKIVQNSKYLLTIIGVNYESFGNSKIDDNAKTISVDISTPQAASIYRIRYIVNSKWRRYIAN